MKPITYKQAMDSEGSLLGLELWQGDQHITISLGHADPSNHMGYKWMEIRKTIDELSERIRKQIYEDLEIKQLWQDAGSEELK